MPSRGSRPSPLSSMAYRAAAIFFAGGLVAYWCAPADPLGAARSNNVPGGDPLVQRANAGAATVSDRVQELLAQGGCPGWITLASDAELQSSLNGRPVVYDGALRETAAHE